MTPSRTHPAARRELRAAIDHAEAERPGRGIRLVQAVERVVRRVERLPRSAPIWSAVTSEHEVRCAKVRRHPYVVFYAVHADHLVILAVAHTRKQPGYWADRVDDATSASRPRRAKRRSTTPSSTSTEHWV